MDRWRRLVEAFGGHRAISFGRRFRSRALARRYFAAGIVAWFALPTKADWIGFLAACAIVAVCGVAPWKSARNYPYLRQALVVIALLAIAGCLTVWARSSIVGEVPIERPIVGTFTAKVLQIEPQPALERDRLILSMREPVTGRAIKVRVNVPGRNLAGKVAIDDVVRFKGRLMPPAPPMLPGAYNFARTAWFSGIAASGSSLGEIAVVKQSGGGGRKLSDMRRALANHIRAQIGDERAGIATALVTGDRGGIMDADAEAMRDSGLAHLLSVSGLHVGAVVGAVYVLSLRVLALSTWLALRLRLPVAAAGIGALAGVGYTLLSGSEVPTVRSCLGALLVLAALSLGREALSLRMLAVAAFCVMLLWPESVTGPSFQMSFGAVLALVAVSTSAPAKNFMQPRDEFLVARVMRHLAMLLLTGLVIDLALMPIGLFHFHRAGIYGALANVTAIPLTTFVVMPLLAGALLLDVVGAGGPLWWLAQVAIDLLTAIAHWFASRPAAVTILPAGQNYAFVVFVAGGLWLGLWSGKVRWLGLPFALLGAGILALAEPPDVLVSGDGRHVGLLEPGGKRLFVLRNGGEGYARDNLMELAGIEGEPALLKEWPGARCNPDFCAVVIVKTGRAWRLLISQGRNGVPERALAAACDRSDIVISDRWLPRSCVPRWFKADRNSLSQTGGIALNLARQELTTVAQSQGNHGWWRPAPQPLKRPARPPGLSAQ